ncbi:MAG: ADP-ribosylglycohydrolase family protein [Acidobacteriota bacterium]|nr:ADP-ribosylglycohydrolase family protein [Acidobacteriota bacterium]MDE3264261.1 ADP-ribosylglycohydrolase family protein [Acidobacteriota bacterium]
MGTPCCSRIKADPKVVGGFSVLNALDDFGRERLSKQEGWPRHAVEASYPNGVREIEPEPGEPDDDDLAQAIILAEAAIEAGSGDLDVEEVGRRFWLWAEENGRGIGIQTADVLSLIGGARPR